MLTVEDVRAVATAIAKANRSPDSDESDDSAKFVNLVVKHFSDANPAVASVAPIAVEVVVEPPKPESEVHHE